MKLPRLALYNKIGENVKIIRTQTKAKPFKSKIMNSQLILEEKIKQLEEQVLDLKADIILSIYGKFTERENLKNSIRNNRK